MMFLNVPNEDINTLRETFQLVNRMKKEGLNKRGRLNFNLIRIYPNTKIYQIALKNNMINRNTNLLKPTFFNPSPLKLFVSPFILGYTVLNYPKFVIHGLNLNYF